MRRWGGNAAFKAGFADAPARGRRRAGAWRSVCPSSPVAAQGRRQSGEGARAAAFRAMGAPLSDKSAAAETLAASSASGPSSSAARDDPRLRARSRPKLALFA